MNLREYEHAKFELAELLRSVAVHAEKSAPDHRDRLQELFARLAEDRFNLVVAGRFSRGKTSLMNAMLGTERLPVGIVPLTSVITTVAYGSKEQAIVRYQDERRPAVGVALEALPEYITQQHNPGNAKQVRTAEIKLTAELLRRGFYFIDTPGLGSPIRANTRTTEQFLPEADAFILVTSYESPLSEEELQIIRMANSAAKRVFVVVNKQDIVSAQERADALHYVHEQLIAAMGDKSPEVFSVSARDAIDAARSHDAACLQTSGLTELSAALVRFLMTEKRAEFLLRFCDRVADVISELLPAANAMPLREKLHELSRRIDDEQPIGAQRTATAGPDNPVPALTQQTRQCEICALVNQACFDFLCHFQYELAASPAAQQRHAERGGLCGLHTWQYGGLASPRGVCIAYPALLVRLAACFSELANSALPAASTATRVQALLPSRETCVLCNESTKAERQAVALILRRLATNPEPTLNSLSAICIPHYRLLLAAVDDGEIRGKLLAREAAILDRLAEDMRRYATKHDAIRRSLASDEEMRAGQTALSMLVGHRNVNMAATDQDFP